MNDAQKDFIYKLDPFNIEARYPEYKNMLAKSLNIQTMWNFFTTNARTTTMDKRDDIIEKVKQYRQLVDNSNLLKNTEQEY